MNVKIEVEGRRVAFDLDAATGRWTSSVEEKESDFPFITHVDGKRYELFSDGTFAEAEK